MKNSKDFPKKILLISNVPPCTNYSGGLVLNHLCKFLPKGSLVNFVTFNQLLEPIVPKDLKWIPVKYYNKPYEGWPNLPFKVGTFISLLGETVNHFYHVPKIARSIIEYGRLHKIDCIWAVLEGQTSIRLALKVARTLRVPLYTEIWDPPQWWLNDGSVDIFWKRVIYRKYAKTLESSKKCATASWAMANQYKRDYRAKTVPFLPCLEKNLAYEPAEKIHPGKDLIIALAGQLYALEEWASLVAALDSVNWIINNRKVKIRMLGNWISLKTYKHMNVEYLGWRSQEEALKLMNESDILYCPYWFSSKYKTEAKLSFPSKLTTYLASGRPVLFHGPKYASPNKFLEAKKAAICCNTLDPKEVLKNLKKLADNPKLYQQLTKNARQAFDENLTMESLHKSFANFLEIDKNNLLTL